MSLREKIKNDLKVAMKAKDTIRKEAIRVIMGELARLEQKEPDDADVVKVLKKMIKAERETLAQTGGQGSDYIDVLESYLPKMAGEEEINAWIDANIDFSQFPNRMQAMRPIMAHFGSSADGNTVKKILQAK